MRSDGHSVIIPDLIAEASSGDPHEFARAALEVTEADGEITVVAHSGAGAVVPLVATLKPGTTRQLVFVDAHVPPCEGTFSAGGEFVSALRELATNGVLPKWSQWWGEGVLERLIPDQQRRTQFEAELPEVPIGFFEVPITAPRNWCMTAGAYLLLTEAYWPQADRALSLGWHVTERLGGHLDIVNHERAIADTVVGLVNR